MVAGARDEGYAAGHAQGLEKGVRDGLSMGQQKAMAEWGERLASVQASWAAALDGFVHEREQLLAAARIDVLRLALSIAERVTRRTIETDTAIVQEQIARVLEMLSRPTRIKIRINPEDEPASRAALPGLMQRYAAAEHVEVVVDSSLQRGSCVASSAGGELDASISTMLDRIARSVLPCDVAPVDTRLASATTAESPPVPSPTEAQPPSEAA
jgi:flagellar assembly protein FliH